MDRHAEIGKHCAPGNQKKYSDAKSDEYSADQNRALPRTLFVLRECDVYWHYARRVDHDEQRHQGRQAKPDKVLIHKVETIEADSLNYKLGKVVNCSEQ